MVVEGDRHAHVSRFVLVWLVLVGLLGTPATVGAQQRSVEWQRYDVDLNIQSDGSVQVTETQTIQFQGTYQQGFRVIPTDRVTSIDDVSVAGTTAYRTSPTNQGLRVDWSFPPTTDAARTFVLAYTLHDAIRIYDAGDQLQWKAIYADRQGPVAASTVTVHLPAAVASADLKTSFSRFTASQTGALAADGTAQQVDPRTLRFTIGDLPAGSGAEVRVQFPHGLVPGDPPAWQAGADRADWVQQSLAPIGNFLALLLALAILAGGGAAVFLVWYTRGRDPAPGTVPPRLDQPPSDLPAPLAGTLVDGVADVQDAVATLVDLAQRGVLSLIDEGEDVRVALKQAPPETAGLRRYERQLLAALFDVEARSGASIRLSAARDRFAAAIPVLEESLHRAVADEGLFVRDPQADRNSYRRVGWLLVGLGAALAVVGAVTLGWTVGLIWLPGAGLAVVGVALVAMARAMPRRTRVGALEAARWRAFRAHLAHPDVPGSAIRPEDLPYAVAFGIDRTFLQRLERVGGPPPQWYAPTSGWGMPGGVVVLPGGFGGGYGPHQHDGGWSAPTGDGQGPGLPDPQGWSDALADLLNGASDALGSGGGSGGWSGGGFGGGGGGGGGSGGFS